MPVIRGFFVADDIQLEGNSLVVRGYGKGEVRVASASERHALCCMSHVSFVPSEWASHQSVDCYLVDPEGHSVGPPPPAQPFDSFGGHDEIQIHRFLASFPAPGIYHAILVINGLKVADWPIRVLFLGDATTQPQR